MNATLILLIVSAVLFSTHAAHHIAASQDPMWLRVSDVTSFMSKGGALCDSDNKCVRLKNVPEKDAYLMSSAKGTLKAYQYGELQSPSFVVGEEAADCKSPVMLMTDDETRALGDELMKDTKCYPCHPGDHMRCEISGSYNLTIVEIEEAVAIE